jgi:hypothetical protein
MKYRKSKAHERHKLAVQQAYDFAVTVCYAVPHLATHLTAVEAGQASLQAPQYFALQNTTQFLRANIVTFEQRLTEQSLALLRRILAQARDRIPEEDPRWAFIFRHGRNICDLGDDVLALESRNRSTRCSSRPLTVIARARSSIRFSFYRMPGTLSFIHLKNERACSIFSYEA